MDFEALTDFRLVALHGGFAKASRVSGHSKATLSRRVIGLEESLGVRLLDRDPGKLRLTEEGRLLFERAEHLLVEIETIREEVSARVDQPRGRLRIAAPTLFSHMALGRLSAMFLSKYPEVQIETFMVDCQVDITEEGFDLLIQVNPLPSSDLVGRCFLRDRVVIVAPASLKHFIDEEDNELGPVPVIVSTGSAPTVSWRVARRQKMLPLKVVLRLPSRLMIRDAVREGLGAAELPFSIVASDLASGHLQSWGPAPQEDVEMWALHTSRRLVSKKVSMFTQFLCDTFRNEEVRYEDWNSGAGQSK